MFEDKQEVRVTVADMSDPVSTMRTNNAKNQKWKIQSEALWLAEF